MSAPAPPRFLERILEWALPDGLSGQSTLGDLAEGFAIRARHSPFGARVWYAWQTASLLVYRVLSGSGTTSAGHDSDFLTDLRWSFRSIARHPAFAISVVTVLGLGLGSNLAVFTVVDGTLENSSWWSAPERTLAIWPDRNWSYGNLTLYEEEQVAYRTLGEYVQQAFALRSTDGESLSVKGVTITPALFQELAVQPMLGRALSEDDAYVGAEPVVVLGAGLWRRAFGADPAIVGRSIQIGGSSVLVVGVQGEGGVAPGGDAELWLPLWMDPRDDDYFKAVDKKMVGVLRDGVTPVDAEADLASFATFLSNLFPSFYPPNWAREAYVERADAAHRSMIATPLLLLLAGTGLLLLVTALNVGNLLLGRSIDRRKELAVRASLGAARGRIVRQLLVEGLVLTVLGLGLGAVVATWGGRWIARLFVEEPIVAASSVLSPAVMIFAAGISLLAWVVLNGVPVVYFLRGQTTSLAAAPDSGAAVQRGLVTVQAAVATLLLVSATLLVATVDNLRSVPLGFEPDEMIAVELSPPEDRVGSSVAARQMYARLVAEAEALPEVRTVGLTASLPLRKGRFPRTGVNLESAPVDPREASTATKHSVDPGFFEVFGIEPIEGRLLDSRDMALDTPSAIVINESMAQALWPDGNAIGQRIAIDPHAWDRWTPIVGIVPDIRADGMTGAIGPALFVSLAEEPRRDVTLVLRTSEGLGAMAPRLREAVRAADPLVPIRGVSSMGDVVRSAYATSWVLMGLLILLAILATGLGAIGIYAVLAHHVALNRKAIGVRLALGAAPGRVVSGVVRSGLLTAGLGIVIGCVGAFLSTRYLESMLFEVSALEPIAFLAPAVGLGLAAALAAWIPAARAGRLPPAEVLRAE